MNLDPVEQFRKEVRENFRGVSCLRRDKLLPTDLYRPNVDRKSRVHLTLRIV